ncbi:hypothetical protein BOX15_Mlig014514g1, partial [Macrostomum lignano]
TKMSEKDESAEVDEQPEPESQETVDQPAEPEPDAGAEAEGQEKPADETAEEPSNEAAERVADEAGDEAVEKEADEAAEKAAEEPADQMVEKGVKDSAEPAEEAEAEATASDKRKVGSAPAKQIGGGLGDEENKEEGGEQATESQNDVEGETQEESEEVEQKEAAVEEDGGAETERQKDEAEAAAGMQEVEEDGAQESEEKENQTGQEQGEPGPEPLAPAPTQANLQQLATLRLVLPASNQVLTVAMPLLSTIGQVKAHVSAETRRDPTELQVLFNGKPVADHFAVADFGVDANETIAFEVECGSPDGRPLRLPASAEARRGAGAGGGDVITVRVPGLDSSTKEVNVEIDRQLRRKPFLGGYRHKRSGVEYHHAQTQTNPKPKPPSLVPVFNRDTQTVESKHQTQQTSNATSTQMTKPGVYVSTAEDKLVVPGRYENADEYQKRMLSKIVTVQTYYRRWLAKQYVSRLKQERDTRLEWERQEEVRKRKEKEDRTRREFERRMNPKTKEDFELLYSTLEQWRREELDRINATLTGAERKAALCQLLDQETELIAAVDRHQLDSSKENKEKAVQSLLKKAAAPKKWRNGEGKLLEMDTPFTLRGRELLGIYNSLQMKYLTQDERLDVLLTLKHTVKEHECKLTRDLIELIDREADLLIRGVAEDKLSGLRKRISTLFLQYCKTPTFNPEIADLLAVPQDPAQLRHNVHYCSSCGRYLKSTEFPLGVKSDKIGKCRRCLAKDNVARAREDQSAFKRMLWLLRKKEGGQALLIEEADLKHLVNNIWEGQSILSCWDDIADLELVRWDVNKPWSPSNCVLLTKDEADAHEAVGDLSKAYGNMLIHRVKQKHVLATNYFHSISGASEKMQARELELRNVRITTK